MQAADVVILVPPDDSAAERQRFVLVVWLARTYAVCGHTCPSAESRREFGIGADDCVSSISVVSIEASDSIETPAFATVQ